MNGGGHIEPARGIRTGHDPRKGTHQGQRGMNTTAKPRRWLRGFRRAMSGLLVLMFWLSLCGAAGANQSKLEDPNRVKAAFVRNFAHYVKWPQTAFESAESPWHIGVLGDASLGEVLESALRGRIEQGRRFEIHAADVLNKLPPCHIVVVAFEDSRKRRAALAELKGKPVLTVGDAADTLKDGGIIRFELSDRIQMGVNLDQARAASLSIPTEMLEVSTEVLEHGVVRRMR
jgi:hypothetical protein